MKVQPYYSGASAAFYDQMTAADDALAGDIDLYASLAPAGGSLLELGSGTGRIAQALASRGFSVVGIELSTPMLKQAEDKRSAASSDVAERIRYVRGDMTNLSVGHIFDAVICPYYGLAHMPPGPAWKATLKGATRHLRPGGHAAFHMPIAEQMSRPAPDPTLPVRQLDGVTLFVAGQALDPRTGRYNIDVDYVEADRRSRERLTLYRGDVEPFAVAAGLIRDRPAVALGQTGHVHIFRKGT